LFTNIVVILIGIWAALDKRSLEAIAAYIIAIGMSILNDIILLGLFFSDSQDRAGSMYVMMTLNVTVSYR